jgi:hypothetical protein
MSGGAQIFRHDGATWTLEQTFSGPAGNCYGCALSLSSDVLVIGAQGDDTICPPFGNSGLVFVYRFNGTQWSLEQTLSPDDAACSRDFGKSVAVSADRIIATAPGVVLGGPFPRAYIFEYDPLTGRMSKAAPAWDDGRLATKPVKPAGPWRQVAALPPQGGQYGARPRSAAIQGDLAAVGAFSTGLVPPPPGGRAYIYQRSAEGAWTEIHTLIPQPSPTSNFFGGSVWIDQGRAIVGAHGEDMQNGAAYIFNLEASPADFNCDGVVNGLDLGNLLANWSIPPDTPGCFGDSPCSADLNSDGLVNGLDLGILLANWTL